MGLVKKMSQKKRSYQTAVIGAGPAGLMAAITAAAYGGPVLLLEKNPRPGKKLLSTGNGKCNYTNEEQGLSCYRGDDPAFVLSVFSQFGHRDLITFLKKLGILPWERNGYYYPFSGQASSVLEVLEAKLSSSGVSLVTEAKVTKIVKKEKLFFITAGSDTYTANTCIVTCGGLAAPATGSDGFGLLAAKSFHHTVIAPHPALVPLLGKGGFLSQWAGVRTPARVSAWVDGVEIASDTGELQLTKDGISGIPVFQISRFLSKALMEGKQAAAEIDFLPQMSDTEAFSLLFSRFFHTDKNHTVGDAMVGLLHRKLHTVLCQRAKLDVTRSLTSCGKKELSRLVSACKHFEFPVTGTRGFAQAQTTAGGVSTRELSGDTMESRLCGGLYFAGEVVDIEGICGGYNLQWAFSSGYVAGLHAALEENK